MDLHGAKKLLRGFTYQKKPSFSNIYAPGEEGSQGNVFFADSLQLGPVAIKIGERKQVGEKVADLFKREAQIMSQKLEYIVTVHKYELTPNKTPVLIMEKGLRNHKNAILDNELELEDGSIYDITFEDKEHVLGNICEGLCNFTKSLTAEGLGAHRDLKPSNIILFYDYDLQRPIAKIGDFGLAVISSKSTSAKGTIEYRAPEISRGRKTHPDWKADQFSLGLVAVYNFSGTTPFERKMGELVDAMDPYDAENEMAEYKKKFNPETDVDFKGFEKYSEFIIRLLQLNPKNRYQSTDEMLQSFRKASAFDLTEEYRTYDKQLTTVVNKKTKLTKGDFGKISTAIKGIKQLAEEGLDSKLVETSKKNIRDKISLDRNAIVKDYANKLREAIPSDMSNVSDATITDISGILDKFEKDVSPYVQKGVKKEFEPIKNQVNSFMSSYRDHSNRLIEDIKGFFGSTNGKRFTETEKNKLEKRKKDYDSKLDIIESACKAWKGKMKDWDEL